MQDNYNPTQTNNNIPITTQIVKNNDSFFNIHFGAGFGIGFIISILLILLILFILYKYKKIKFE